MGITNMQHRRFNLQQEKPPVNWRRGMLRLWILVSSAWLMGWLIYFAIKFMSGEFTTQHIPVVPVVLFGPPLALLLFGLGARWAILGFETDQAETPLQRNDPAGDLRQDNKRA
jgi:hypothetical protein